MANSKALFGRGLEIIAGEGRSGQPRKYGVKKEAKIIALACSDPPEGRAGGLEC